MTANKTTRWMTLAAAVVMTMANFGQSGRTACAQVAMSKSAPPQMVAPLPAGQAKPLQAAVMQVKGSAEWRPTAEAAWKQAKVDDLLSPGAQIRTGRASELTLRAGHNATVVVAAMTRVDLPEMLQDGATLRTRAGLARGKADFKVDQVGLANDFEVITPSSTLAVRGTGFGVRWGALEGASVEGYNGNQIAAIELQYFSDRMLYDLSGRAVSNETHQNPVIAALYNTVAPPPVVGKIIEAVEAALANGELVDSDFQSLRDVDLSTQSSAAVAEILTEIQTPGEFDITIPPDINPSFFFAQLLCSDQGEFTGQFQAGLATAGLFDPQVGDPNFTAFVSSLDQLCDSLEAGTFKGDDPFLQVVLLVQSYCGTMDGQVAFDTCIQEAGSAMGFAFASALGPAH